MSPRQRGLLVLALWTAFPRAALSCPCQGASGAAASVTTAFDRLGVSLTETSRIVHGAWRSRGSYAPLSDSARQWGLDVAAVVGVRPVSPLELSAETAFGHQATTSPVFSTEHTGVGDTTVRVRWEAIDEPMPYERPAVPFPALVLIGSLRMPTAAADRGGSGSGFAGTTGSVGASASSEGLGAFEPALAVALVRSPGTRWQFSLYGEGAYRFPDAYLGVERHLAPRFFAQAGARYATSSSTGIGATTDLGWEGDVSYPGSQLSGARTRQRLWTVTAYGYLRAEPTGLHWGAALRYAPPVDGIGLNATRATSLSISLGYAVR